MDRAGRTRHRRQPACRIGFAIARRLAADGVRVFAHHHVPHDADRDWGADPAGIDAVIDAIGGDTATSASTSRSRTRRGAA